MWRSAYTPGCWLTVKPVGCTLTALYVQSLHISYYVTVNKLVLSYLLVAPPSTNSYFFFFFLKDMSMDNMEI
jgi:hypothetical protein